MLYTITALAPTEETLLVMRQSLEAVGASRDAITTRPGKSGTSLPQISITTSDLVLSEVYRDVLELAGGSLVAASEESSVFDVAR